MEIEEKKINGFLNYDISNSKLIMDIYNISKGEKSKKIVLDYLTKDLEQYILIEPFEDLDYESKRQVKQQLINMKHLNKTIAIISEDINILYELCDNITVYKNGKKILETKELIKDIDLFIKHKIKLPEIVEFSYYVLQSKKVKLGYYETVKDLIKAVYRDVGY